MVVEGGGGPEQGHVGPVGQHDQGDDLAGGGPLERVGQQQRGLGRAGVAHGGQEVLGRRGGAGGDLGGDLSHGPGVGAGHDDLADGVGVQAGGVQRLLPRLLAEGHVLHLAEALLPLLGADVAGGAPAVEELLGERDAPEVLGQHRGVRAVLTDQQGGGGVASLALIRAGGQPGAHVGHRHQRRAPAGEGGAQCAHGRAHRPVGVEGGGLTIEAESGVDHGGVGLVHVGRRGGREPQRVDRGPAGVAQGTQGQTRRLDGHGGGVLVVGGHRAGALAGVGAAGRGDGRPVEPVIGHVAGEAQDPSHDVPLMPLPSWPQV